MEKYEQLVKLSKDKWESSTMSGLRDKDGNKVRTYGLEDSKIASYPDHIEIVRAEAMIAVPELISLLLKAKEVLERTSNDTLDGRNMVDDIDAKLEAIEESVMIAWKNSLFDYTKY